MAQIPVHTSDPLHWLGLTQTALLDRGEKGNFYVDELCRLWPVNTVKRCIMDAYTVIFILDFLAAAGRDGDLEEVPWLFEALVRFTGCALGESAMNVAPEVTFRRGRYLM